VIILEEHTVEAVNDQTRFIDYAIKLFPQLPSRNAVKKAIKRKQLIHNGIEAATGSWVMIGDVIQFVEGVQRVPKAFPLHIKVVYKDEHFIIVNKPSGLVVSGNQYRTLENSLIDQLDPSKEKDALPWIKPVHRLDSATSGLVICARTFSARIALMKLFEERKIEKTYRAVVTGKFVGFQTIEEEIEGVEARSEFQSMSVANSLRNGHVSLVEMSPSTGRTHQLRIHAKHIGHSIVGDKIYGEKGNTMLHKGLFLAAVKLKFSHPVTNELMEVEIDQPAKFSALLEREERRWKNYQAS